MEKIPVMKPLLPKFQAVTKYLNLIDENRIYSNNGPLYQSLSERYAEMFKVPVNQVVLVANATLAIQGAAFLMPVESFVVPTWTFPASISGVLNGGKSVTLRDIEYTDWRIDLREIDPSDKIGVVDVLPFGQAIDLDKNSNWKYVIVDAAASLGSNHFNLSALKEKWVVVFSLHATKVLGIGEGGIAVFGSVEEADKFRAWINFGFLGSRNSILPGINAKMPEVSAAYGLAVMEQKQIEITDWTIANQSARKISCDLEINNITNNFDSVSPYWIVQLKSVSTAQKVEERMSQSGIDSRRWWGHGCHQMPAFKPYATGNKYPIAEMLAGTTLGLPMFRDIKPLHFEIISEALKDVL